MKFLNILVLAVSASALVIEPRVDDISNGLEVRHHKGKKAGGGKKAAATTTAATTATPTPDAACIKARHHKGKKAGGKAGKAAAADNCA